MKRNTKREKCVYECIACGVQYDLEQTRYLCPVCADGNTADQPPAGVLKVQYDYIGLRDRGACFNTLSESGFIDLLPIHSMDSMPGLRIGQTPFYSLRHLNEEALPESLYIKDDGLNPTFSFKDRASALVSAYAKERGYPVIVTASTGNAGSSLAGICAAQGQKAIIMLPDSAPLAKLTQVVMYGATIVPVKGSYDDAFELSLKATEAFGWYNRNTGYNPLTIEGKKIAAFEIFQQLGYKVPGRVFVPVGDGVILSGLYKGFEDLLRLGLTDRMPVMVAVQAEGSNNLVRNMDAPRFQSMPGHTIADSISVNVPRNFFMARHYLQQYEGETICVSDADILQASSLLARQTGIFTEPASAAAFAGMMAYKKRDELFTVKDNVVLLTGSGLKDLMAVRQLLNIPEAIEPDISQLKSLLKQKSIFIG
jgi:threonine synthase